MSYTETSKTISIQYTEKKRLISDLPGLGQTEKAGTLFANKFSTICYLFVITDFLGVIVRMIYMN